MHALNETWAVYVEAIFPQAPELTGDMLRSVRGLCGVCAAQDEGGSGGVQGAGGLGQGLDWQCPASSAGQPLPPAEDI